MLDLGTGRRDRRGMTGAADAFVAIGRSGSMVDEAAKSHTSGSVEEFQGDTQQRPPGRALAGVEEPSAWC
jgi:hypothetical protein